MPWNCVRIEDISEKQTTHLSPHSVPTTDNTCFPCYLPFPLNEPRNGLLVRFGLRHTWIDGICILLEITVNGVLEVTIVSRLTCMHLADAYDGGSGIQVREIHSQYLAIVAHRLLGGIVIPGDPFVFWRRTWELAILPRSTLEVQVGEND